MIVHHIHLEEVGIKAKQQLFHSKKHSNQNSHDIQTRVTHWKNDQFTKDQEALELFVCTLFPKNATPTRCGGCCTDPAMTATMQQSSRIIVRESLVMSMNKEHGYLVLMACFGTNSCCKSDISQFPMFLSTLFNQLFCNRSGSFLTDVRQECGSLRTWNTTSFAVVRLSMMMQQ